MAKATELQQLRALLLKYEEDLRIVEGTDSMLLLTEEIRRVAATLLIPDGVKDSAAIDYLRGEGCRVEDGITTNPRWTYLIISTTKGEIEVSARITNPA